MVNKLARFNFLFQQIKPYGWQFCLLLICVIASSMIGTFYPFYLGKMIDSIVYKHNYKSFFYYFLLYGAVFFLHQVAWFFNTRIFTKLKTTFLLNIRLRCFKKIFSYPAADLDNIQSGDIVNRLDKNVNQILDYIYFNVFYTIADIIELVMQLAFIAVINFWIFVFTLISMPISFFIAKYFVRHSAKHYQSVNQHQNKVIAWIFDVINGIQEIKLLCATKIILGLTRTLRKDLIREEVKVSKIEVITDTNIAITSFIIQMFLYGLSAYLVFKGELLIGGFIAIVEYFNASLVCFKDILGRGNPIMQNLVSIDDIKYLLERNSESEDCNENKIAIDNGVIEFKNVAFSYEKEMVLNNISFKVNSMERIAIVGNSGSGKSTIINLLLKFYKIKQGNIFIDGKDINDYPVKLIRERIGVVDQQNSVFSGTIRFNLQFSDNLSNDHLLWESLKHVHLKSFVESLPDKLDTVLGAGRELSGGQLQRLAIARIYLRNPQIIVFDESTSALDRKTENLLMDSWKSLCINKTILIISHRLTSIMECDKILVIDHGHVVGYGNHSELITTCSKYNQLYHNQFETNEVFS